MSRDQIFKFKKLRAFAIREYKEKRPKRVIVRRINSVKILPREIIQAIKLRNDIELNPFLLISDFGNEVRLYYLLPDCTMLGAENISGKDFKTIESKIKKYSKKVLVLPQKTAEEMFDERRTAYHKMISQMKNLKFTFKELEEKFSRDLNSLSQLTGLKGTLKNITLTDEPSKGKRFGVIVDKHKLNIYVRCLNSPLIEGIIYRECLFALIPTYITCDLTDICSFGAYILLSGENKENWAVRWSETTSFDTSYLKNASKNDLKKIFGLFGFLQPYLDKKNLSEQESMRLINIILDNLKKSNRQIAFKFFEYLAEEYKSQKSIYDVLKAKQLLLQYLDMREVPLNIKMDGLKSIELAYYLINMKYNEFYTQYNQIKDIPKGLNRLFLEFLRENQPIKLELIYPNQINFQDILNFQIIIKNLSNLTFSIINIKDSFSKIFEQIEEEESEIEKIGPNERVDFNLKLKPTKKGNFKLKSFQISCESNFGTIYRLKSKPIKINII